MLIVMRCSFTMGQSPLLHEPNSDMALDAKMTSFLIFVVHRPGG